MAVINVKVRKTKDPFYVKCTVEQFKDKLSKCQRTKPLRIIIDYNEKQKPIYEIQEQPIFTRHYVFCNAVELDNKDWKRDLINTKKVKFSKEKMQVLKAWNDFNQDLLIDLSIQQGNAFNVWSKIYASEYVNDLNDAEAKAQINISLNNSKTGKLEIK